jgi:hypothetical protein
MALRSHTQTSYSVFADDILKDCSDKTKLSIDIMKLAVNQSKGNSITEMSQ